MRYTPQGAWLEFETDLVTDYENRPLGTVITEFSDLLDTRDGQVYRGGSRRVRVETAIVLSDLARSRTGGNLRSKTFRGERAPDQAKAYHNAAVRALDFEANHQIGW